MLNLEPADLENTYRSAIEAAALLRRCGETSKAARVESLARILARELSRREGWRRDPGARPGFETKCGRSPSSGPTIKGLR